MTSEHTWKVMIRPAILPGGELWFPQRLSREFLEVQRERDPYFFSCSYLNEPIPPEEQRFRPEWIRYADVLFKADDYTRIVDKSTGREYHVWVTMAIDPAISDKKKSDYTGIVTVGTTTQGIWYVLGARRVKGGVDNITQAVVEEVRRLKPVTVGVEAVAFQVVLKDILRNVFANEGIVGTRLVELKSGSGRSKRARIEGLVPLFAEGRIFLCKGIDPELERELKEWMPGAELGHDDLIDALSHQLALSKPAPPTGVPTPIVDIHDLPPEERKKYRKRWDEGEESRDPMTGY
jgi:phage terminase large subunit-like protein